MRADKFKKYRVLRKFSEVWCMHLPGKKYRAWLVTNILFSVHSAPGELTWINVTVFIPFSGTVYVAADPRTG